MALASVVSASPLQNSAPKGAVFRVDVNYGSGYAPFVEVYTNAHQVNALSVFLSSERSEMIVRIPHALGDEFVAKFIRVDNNTVKYYKETGAEVFFRITC